MTKETYVKPEIRSEVIEPGALASSGSGGGDNRPWLEFLQNPSASVCCED